MKLLEKLKNTFFEEEFVEVEEKPKAVAKKVELKPSKKDSIKRETRVKEEPKKEMEEDEIDDDDFEEDSTPAIHYSDNDLAKDNKFTYFEDEDFFTPEFVEEEKKEEEVQAKTIYGELADTLYSSIPYDPSSYHTPYGATSKGAFQPTPIISPIYGILDKNYTKEEVVDKKETDNYIARSSIDLDNIRNKAYGTESVVENAIDDIVEDVKQEEEIDVDIPVTDSELLYDMTDDDKVPTVDQVTIADAEEYFEDLGLEYNIDYKDTHYEKATGRRASAKKKEEVVEEDDTNLEDNLFDVIDSMYEEGEEEE